MNFKEWFVLNEHKATQGKSGLYPSLYTQYYNYTPSDIVTWSADAIVYMDPEDIPQKIVSGFYAKIIRKTIGNFGKTNAGGG